MRTSIGYFCKVSKDEFRFLCERRGYFLILLIYGNSCIKINHTF